MSGQHHSSGDGSQEAYELGEEFDDWTPSDGWRVRDFDSHLSDEISLWMELTVNGETHTDISKKVWSSPDRSPMSQGNRNLARVLWEGIARFLNAGGSMLYVDSAIRQAGLDMIELDWKSRKLFPLDVTHDEDNGVYYVFGSQENANRILVWREDLSTEWMLQSDLQKLLIDEDDSEDLYD